MEAVRIFHLEPSDLSRDGLGALLAGGRQIVLAGGAANLTEALLLAGQLSFDVLITCYELPDSDLVGTIREFRCLYPDLPVILLLDTTIHSMDLLLAAFDAGVNTILTSDVKPEEFVKAIQSVNKGESYFQTTLASRLIEALQRRTSTNESDKFSLPERERKVLELLAAGHSNVEIADLLNVSLSTVKTELRRLFKRLGVSSRTELLVLALQVGLVESSSLND